MKHWPLRSRLALWTAILLTVELAIFGIASGWMIFHTQVDAFREIGSRPVTENSIQEETRELLLRLIVADFTALPLAVLVAAFGVWWITGKALKPLQDIADAAERIHAKALRTRIPDPRVHDEIGRLVCVLNDTFDRLERSFTQATRFSSDASHELKTPLTIMRGEIESALANDSADAPTEKLLESLLQQTHHLSAIVENLLLLSRADAGALNLRKSTVDLSELCDELAADAEILALQGNIDISSNVAHEVRVLADEWYLRRLLLNLLDNAIKYNLNFGKVEISLTKSGDLATFRIANTGPEISEEHQSRIFERFYRTEASRASEVVGSGLGLSICREIVLAHQGQIWMEKSHPGWTAFVVNLPLAARIAEPISQ
ncbi:MAG TPA: ATP-binding protein [Chthoniobacterales bacterium]|nr:ATP-binding protein [Chthoniobacterales bacterium]